MAIMWDAIKKFLQRNRPACLLIEDGQPRYVVLNYEEYEEMCKARPKETANPSELAGEKINSAVREADDNIASPVFVEEAPLGKQIEKINQEISQIQSEIKSAEAASVLDRENEITVENLPVF